eukprot:TRINITY_DN103760_c0_g1_i1.p1 TRINITY_DN103760_c0_g1~~TRINITY_DN103760_c0_g1_i1.p1  ORF type:complete len:331 (+),score=49.31 TRINITY_DN103760_c0_g1_i1:46-993(+)
MPAMRLPFLCLALPAASHKLASSSNGTANFLALDHRENQYASNGAGFVGSLFSKLGSYLLHEGATPLQCKENFVRSDDVMTFVKDLGEEAAALEDDTCFHPDVKRSSIDACLAVPDASKPAIYVAGDSHAVVLSHGLQRSVNWQGGYIGYSNVAMSRRIDDIIDGLERAVKPGDVVVWSENFVVLKVEDYQSHIEKLKRLTAKQANVMLVGDVVSLPQEPEMCLLRRLPCTKKRAEVEDQRKPFIDTIIRASESSLNKMWAVNLQPEFCSEDDCGMYITGTKTLGFMDQDHINRVASDYLGYKICTAIQTNLKAK